MLALHLISRDELEPGPDGEVELHDVEDGSIILESLSPALLSAYRKAFEAHGAAISAFCTRNGWGYVRAVTDDSFESLVLQALRKEGLLR